MEAGSTTGHARPELRLVQPAVFGRASSGRLMIRISTYVALLVLTLLFMGPFAFAFTTSFKSPDEIFLFPPRLIPEHWLWHNYIDAWTKAPFALFFTNTVIITVLSMVGQVISSCSVAYGFARFRFPGRDALFILVIGTLILP